MPAIGGAPGSTLAVPHVPTESTTSGSTDRGIENASSTASFQSLPSTSRSAEVAADALVWSLTCDAPPDNVHATQLSTVPKHRSRPDSSPVLPRIQASFVTDWFGAIDQPCSTLAT